MTRNDSPDKLTPRQQRFVNAMTTAVGIKAAAALAGISERTAHRFMAEPTVKAALTTTQARALEDLSRGLVRLGEKATATLEAAMDNPDATDAARIRAADIVLARLLQLRELVDLEARVADLEQRLTQ